jgi:hypothetical protein
MFIQKSKYALLVALAVTIFSAAGAAEDKDPNALSLDLYQRIKAHFDALYGARSGLAQIMPANQDESEKALHTDATSHKDELIKALGAKSALQRQLAASVLEYCGDRKAAVAALCDSLASDGDPDVRRAAAGSLAKLPDAAAVEALLKALADNVDAVRGLSATALGNIKDNRASEGLLRLLDSDLKPIIRMQAATALSKIKDATTFERLKKALETEKDERVKMAIHGALRKLMGESSAQAAEGPSTEEASQYLASLAKDMKDVESKLRDDRHDQAVQTEGQHIEEKLAKFIEQLEQMSSSNSSSGENEKKNKQQQQQQQQGNQGGQRGSNPLQQSKPGGAVPPGALNPATVSGKQDAWAKLPPALRDELLQSYRPEIPLRWQKRLEAYYYSLNAEETKDLDK